LVHIGPPKTGTSALQSALHVARERLARHDVVFPGTGRHPHSAVHAVIGRAPLLGHAKPSLTSWTDLVEEVSGAGGSRVVVSSEFFADGDDTAIRRIVEDLGGRRHHHDQLIERWSAVVGPENLTVVVADQSRPEMLLRTFESLLALPSGILVPRKD
jgi:hypothetical protein